MALQALRYVVQYSLLQLASHGASGVGGGGGGNSAAIARRLPKPIPSAVTALAAPACVAPSLVHRPERPARQQESFLRRLRMALWLLDTVALIQNRSQLPGPANLS